MRRPRCSRQTRIGREQQIFPSRFWRLRQGSVASFRTHLEHPLGDGHPFLPLTASNNGMRCALLMPMAEHEERLNGEVLSIRRKQGVVQGEDDRDLS